MKIFRKKIIKKTSFSFLDFSASLSLVSSFLIVCLIPFLFSSCIFKKDEKKLGTEKQPIQFTIIPTQDLTKLEEVGKKMETWLNAQGPLKFQVKVPQSYVAVVEAFGTKRADVAIINTFGYVLAHDKYGVEAHLTIINSGRSTYRGEIIARKDKGPKNIKEINGKKFAFVDAASSSGFLMPTLEFKRAKVVPKETVFAGRHDSVVSMVYQGQADAGATYYNPDVDNGIPQDARRLLRTQYPDVFEKISIIHLTDEIPNDPIVYRKDLPPEMKEAITTLLIKFINSDVGEQTFKKSFKITGFVRANDTSYNQARKMLTELGRSAQDFIK